MGTWNAIYFRGHLPDGFRPSVVGPCPVRRVSEWLELALPGVDDGEATTLALSKQVSGQVIWAYVQTTASCVGVMHCENGEVLRRIEFADGSWRRVEGQPQPWEAWLFSDEELEEARDIGPVEGDPELEFAFARKTLETGHELPSPREWEALLHAIGVTWPDWKAAHDLPPLSTLEGDKTSKLAITARLALALGVASVVARFATRNTGFSGLAVLCLLLAFGAGFLRKATVGRWFL